MGECAARKGVKLLEIMAYITELFSEILSVSVLIFSCLITFVTARYAHKRIIFVIWILLLVVTVFMGLWNPTGHEENMAAAIIFWFICIPITFGALIGGMLGFAALNRKNKNA